MVGQDAAPAAGHVQRVITGEGAQGQHEYAENKVGPGHGLKAGGNGQQHADHDHTNDQHVDVDPGDLRIQLGKGAGLRGDPAERDHHSHQGTHQHEELVLAIDLLQNVWHGGELIFPQPGSDNGHDKTAGCAADSIGQGGQTIAEANTHMAHQHAAAHQGGKLRKDNHISGKTAAAHGPVFGGLSPALEVQGHAEADEHDQHSADQDQQKPVG